MATLAANTPRAYDIMGDERDNDLPVINADIIYEGAAVGISSGLARPLVAADAFQGFALQKADNAAGAASAINVRVRERGAIQLAVAGASAVTDRSSTVYATDDNTFTLTASGASSIGKVLRWVTSTTCIVYFESAALRSI